MQHGDLLCERLDIPDRMHKSVFHMPADLCTHIGGERNASAANGFRNHKRKALLYAGKDQKIAFSHQLGNVSPVSQELDAGMGQHRREPVLIRGQELARYQESATPGSWRFQPSLEGEMKPFPYRAHANKQHSQAAPE